MGPYPYLIDRQPFPPATLSLDPSPLASQAVAVGLDRRFGWSPAIPLWLWLVGLVVLIMGNALSSWAMISNAFFAGTVSIQQDRGHTTVTGAPYHYVRHPAYSGWILSNLAIPLVLGSQWASIPAVFVAIGFVARTTLGDRTLQVELDGCQAYAGQVRCRLVPGLW